MVVVIPITHTCNTLIFPQFVKITILAKKDIKECGKLKNVNV
jgi:hypothetical protein